MKILGIDLGTSNTYIYEAEAAALQSGITKQPAPVVLPQISDNNGSIATAVLYENGLPILIGNIAESEYYSNLAKQPQRNLASQFKPEISQGARHAMTALTDFLSILRSAQPLASLPPDTLLYVGMPSLAGEDFSVNMGQCFRDAGWPKPRFVRESDAALVSCLQSGSLDIEDLESKCLILDFGGGTCDYTSVKSLDVLQNGGDMLYGGRLFDDMFFQVFCRNDKEFAAQAPNSPYAWYLRWIECRRQKEEFSNFLRQAGGEESQTNENSQETFRPERENSFSLHAVWHTASGERRDAFVASYDRDSFIRDAENYQASPAMLDLLRDYSQRGNLSSEARELLSGRKIGLISWLRSIYEKVRDRNNIAKIILTGGSSRWYFANELAARYFPGAICRDSARGYEDIAYGLALFPILLAAREKTKQLLDEKFGAFTLKAADTARGLIKRYTANITRLCAQRIVQRDVMPALEAAQKKSMTAAELENIFADNIRRDTGLIAIVDQNSKLLKEEIQKELNISFRLWLKENGVPLAPRFQFPGQAIGQDFFDKISVKISRLDSLNLMEFTLTTILPFIAGTATAGAIAHSGEPVSTVIGGGLALGATWLAAKAAPRFLRRRKLPRFLLSEKNRRNIAEKNRTYIEQALTSAFADIWENMALDIEKRLRAALASMLASLTVLNQVETR